MTIGGSVAFSNTNKCITLAFFSGSTMLDKERVPIVYDGTDGTNGVSLAAHDMYWGRNNSGTAAPSDWGTTVLSPTTSQRYVWKKETWTYTAPDRGRNYVLNSNFENDGSKWAFFNGSSASYTTFNNKKWCILKTSATTAWSGMNQNVWLPKPAKAGRWQLSVDMFYSSTNSCPMWFGVKIFAEGGERIGPDLNIVFTPTTTPKRYVADIEVTQAFVNTIGTRGWYMQIHAMSTNSGYKESYVYVTDWKLECGDSATDWTVAPEDMYREEISVWSIYGEKGDPGGKAKSTVAYFLAVGGTSRPSVPTVDTTGTRPTSVISGTTRTWYEGQAQSPAWDATNKYLFRIDKYLMTDDSIFWGEPYFYGEWAETGPKGDDSVNVILAPDTVIVTQSTNSPYTISLTNAYTIVSVNVGGVPVTNFTITNISGTNCVASLDGSNNKRVNITQINSSGGQYYDNGYVKFKVNYNGQIYDMQFNFYANLLGTWKQSVDAGTENIVAQKVTYDFVNGVLTKDGRDYTSIRNATIANETWKSQKESTYNGYATQISNTNTRIDNANSSIQTISTQVGGLQTSVSTIEQTADEIRMGVTNGWRNYVLKPLAVDASVSTVTSQSIVYDADFGNVRQIYYSGSGYFHLDQGFDNDHKTEISDNKVVTVFAIVKPMTASNSQIRFGTWYSGNSGKAGLLQIYCDSSKKISSVTCTETDAETGYEDIGNGWFKAWASFPSNTVFNSSASLCGPNSINGSTWQIYYYGIVKGNGCPSVEEIRQGAGVKKAGIDIKNGTIMLMGDKVTFSDSNGTNTGNIWIDSTDGTLHAVNGNFSGTISSNSGNIGAMSIASNGSLSVTKNGTTTFSVNGTMNGLTATNANVTGVITATSGSFTGTVTANSGTIGNMSIYPDSSIALKIHNSTTNVDTFLVDSSGNVTMNGANITGNFTAGNNLVRVQSRIVKGVEVGFFDFQGADGNYFSLMNTYDFGPLYSDLTCTIPAHFSTIYNTGTITTRDMSVENSLSVYTITVNGYTGTSGSFVSLDGKSVSVNGGIITSITNSSSSSIGTNLVPSSDGEYNLGDLHNGWYTLYLSNGGDNGYISIADDGDVEYNSGSNGHTFYGYIWCDRNISGASITNRSDMRDKDVIKAIDLKVNDIATAPSFLYTCKDGDKRVMTGTSAQYWKTVLPEVVFSDPKGKLSLDYGVTALASAISLARTTITHEEKIAKLEKEIENLNRIINDLKGN